MNAVQILHITDTHLLADPDADLLGINPETSLCAVLDSALSEREPDLVLATGDIANEGLAIAYKRFREHIATRSQARLYCLPGNHDLAAPFGAVPEPVRLGAWQLIALDSHVDKQVRGFIADAELDRLEAALTGSAEFVVITLHHPVLPCGSPWLDKDGIFSGRLHKIIEANKKVRCVVFGHIHQPFEKWHNGVLYLGTPSTCYQFKPGTQSFTTHQSPPGYRWLTLGNTGDIKTQLSELETSNF